MTGAESSNLQCLKRLTQQAGVGDKGRKENE
jgi:hypothetical protein